MAAPVLGVPGLVTLVVGAAAVTSSWMPPPPPPSPVVGWVGQATTLPPANATTTGRPLREAAGGTGRGGHPPAAATAETEVRMVLMAVTPMVTARMTIDAGGLVTVMPVTTPMAMMTRGVLMDVPVIAVMAVGRRLGTGSVATAVGVITGGVIRAAAVGVWMAVCVASPMSMGVVVTLDVVTLGTMAVVATREVGTMTRVG